MKKGFFVLYLAFITHVLTASEPASNAFLSGVPSSFVHGVNVISGTYTATEVDLVVPGGLPIVIQRSYVGARETQLPTPLV